MMTSQIEAQIPPLVQIKDAVTAGYAASLYIAERDKGPHGKRLAVLEIDPDYRVECVLDLQDFGFQEQTMEAMYTVPIEGTPLMVDLGEIEPESALRELLSCLDICENSRKAE
ncbi:hypothetical protein HALDL1_01065 (plasmid) [Halobacterium sp. DL1]|jgi:hypothetical protein|uniref:Uncharacterized protein n=2 Tax=Halorubrum lacusprofundi TaxID=2247 RepID=B9LX13_HALLT|nr:hypothetical protein Hlac_3495 [Halorubrum lacusprofundi ATCC 49239]AHG05593.1 hypothetical protein HALDL1_01065 [Halobacterium sp. DL1]